MMELLEALSAQAEFINSEVIRWVLRLVMVGLGLSLTAADFKRVIMFPKAVTIGLIAKLVGMQLKAFILAPLFTAPPAIAIGLVILAACPSGVTSNAYSFAARADVPLCVTLAAITSVVTVFTIPFLVNLALQTFAEQGQLTELPVLNMLRDLIGFTIVPLVLGMLIRVFRPELADKAVEPIRKGVLYLMIGVLILLTMGLGFGLAKLFKLPLPQVITITFEVGVQNLALAFLITFAILQRPDLAVTGLLYAVVMPATALGFVSIARRLLPDGGAKTAAAGAAGN